MKFVEFSKYKKASVRSRFHTLNSLTGQDIGIAIFDLGENMGTIQLYKEHPDTYEREVLGTISEHQLDFLVDNLEDEFEEDEEYFFIPEMMDDLKAQGADAPLIALLEKALAGTLEGVDIFYRIE
jgi:hypothetical protein